MGEEHGFTGSSGSNVDTSKSERSVWLMKCPLVVAKSWQSHPPSHPQPIAKVVLSLDPLQADDPSALQFTMEMAGTEAANLPRTYSLNMFKDFVPMCVFSETSQGENFSLSFIYFCSSSSYLLIAILKIFSIRE
ncbi:hypothetical protein L6164_015308 [Bauhinia variegata]|uniref:Uncharacterized protein n=1 Tax=Bauhinia variegata TaxID=167791 RepID=A0ACB9NL74_BAUVA|nr:hypothetical protein L6164_015308 [Bauhinia variegata]